MLRTGSKAVIDLRPSLELDRFNLGYGVWPLLSRDIVSMELSHATMYVSKTVAVDYHSHIHTS
jgi:hypothetical protein